MKSSGRASNYAFDSTGTIITNPVVRLVGAFRKQRKISAGSSFRVGVVAVRFQENRDPRRLRHLLRADRQSQLSPRPKRPVQYRLRCQEHPVLDDRSRRDLQKRQGNSERRSARSANAHGRILVAQGRAADSRRTQRSASATSALTDTTSFFRSTRIFPSAPSAPPLHARRAIRADCSTIRPARRSQILPSPTRRTGSPRASARTTV